MTRKDRIAIEESESSTWMRLFYLTFMYKRLLLNAIEFKEDEELIDYYKENYLKNLCAKTAFQEELNEKYNIPEFCPMLYNVSVERSEIILPEGTHKKED